MRREADPALGLVAPVAALTGTVLPSSSSSPRVRLELVLVEVVVLIVEILGHPGLQGLGYTTAPTGVWGCEAPPQNKEGCYQPDRSSLPRESPHSSRLEFGSL